MKKMTLAAALVALCISGNVLANDGSKPGTKLHSISWLDTVVLRLGAIPRRPRH